MNTAIYTLPERLHNCQCCTLAAIMRTCKACAFYTPNTPANAVQMAIDDGYTGITTFMGNLLLNDWLELTSLKFAQYESGKIVTEWLPSILERGKLERLTFVLTR